MKKDKIKRRIDGLTIATDSSNMTLTCDMDEYRIHDNKITAFIIFSFLCLIATAVYITYLFR